MCDAPNYTVNQPAQPSYGEGMADALKAQVELLTGRGDFADIAPDGLEGLVPLEESLRKKTAQVDTDVLRQTLLGGETQQTTRGRYDDEGRFIIGERPTFTETPGSAKINVQGKMNGNVDVTFINPADNSIITTIRDKSPKEFGVTEYNNYTVGTKIIQRFKQGVAGEWQNTLEKANEGIEPTRVEGEPEPIYGRDAKGDIIVDKSKAGEEVDETVTIKNDGMIDLLGDARMTADGREAGFDKDGNFLGLSALAEDIQRGNLSRQREGDLADVEALDDRYKEVMEKFKPSATSGIDDARVLLEQQRENLTGLRKATQEDVDKGLAKEIDEMIQTGREGPVTIPGADTYGGDVTGQTMTAATVGDTPTLDADTSFNAATVADPMALNAATSYDPSADVTGEGYTATAKLEGGNIEADSLRAALLADAEGALSAGLTDREKANISNAARARSTLMGRTFDQSGAIEEAQALVTEDNNRLMQNRGFAQSALGQETDIQRDDLARGLQANMQNQSALNRAAEFGASQGLQAQLANQAATNQALQAGMQAGLSQEALGAQQAQAKAMADAQMLQQSRAMGLEAGMQQDTQQAQFDQQANLAQAELNQQASAFDAQSAQQADVVNQGQAQQAAQFGVGATMDAERLNEQLRQQGLGNYVSAVGNLAQMEDKYSLDPFQALLGRGGGQSLQAGQGVFGQAAYGLQSGPQYLNPEAGLGYISQMAANEANMYGASMAANANRTSGIVQGLGILGGGIFCWVAREVYGPTNPAWLQFREWMFTESPAWFFKLYRDYGERFANWVSDKPRIKSIIRKWMDSKIRR